MRRVFGQAFLISSLARIGPHVELIKDSEVENCLDSAIGQGQRGTILLQSARLTVSKVAAPEPKLIQEITMPMRNSSNAHGASNWTSSQDQHLVGPEQSKVLQPSALQPMEAQPGGGPVQWSMEAQPSGGPVQGTPVVIYATPTPSPQDSLSLRVLRAFTYILLVCIAAFGYTKLVGLQEPPVEAMFSHADGEKGDFYFGILQFDECCGRDQRLCVCAFCCLGIRWAETLSRDKLKFGIGFWSALLFCATCEGFWWLGLPLVFCICAVYYRQKLRATFGLESGTIRTLAFDCFAWWCCAPCAAVQEAREVQYLSAAE